jgi:NAD(P)-dependent dehydrogenase (short-subunit alcohol dehydrogenase family)
MTVPSMFNLAGKVALVTGGSKGLGKAMARGLVEAGADVVISSRHEEELKPALAEILNGTKRQGVYYVADMTRREEVRKLASFAVEKMGKVDILINNAGTNIPQPIDEIKDEDWDHIMEINLNSIMVLTRALVPPMKERRWGRIIHISSIMDLPGRLLSAEEKDRFAKMTALNRWGDPLELVGPALLLASDAGSYITGTTIVVDGGFIAR